MMTVFTPARERFPSIETSAFLNTRILVASPSLVDLESISNSEEMLTVVLLTKRPVEDLRILPSSFVLPDAIVCDNPTLSDTLFVALERAYDELALTVLVVKLPLLRLLKNVHTTVLTLFPRALPMNALPPATFQIIGLDTRIRNGDSRY